MSELISTFNERMTNVRYGPLGISNFQTYYELAILLVNYI